MTTDLTGQTLGQYKLVKLAGEGGIATVYKAYQESLNRWAAIKVLHNTDENVLARFEREAKSAAQLRHRNILMVYEYGLDEYPYIAMEFIEEGTLEDRLNGKPMFWGRVVHLSIHMAEALSYAHQHGLVHRDVKPSNIMMPQEDWPLLADFGLVKVTDADEALTVAGTIMGTPAYIAPEQARGDDITPHVDMYALGVIMFEMIAGRLPFDYENPNLLMLAHIQEEPPSPREFNPACPPELEAIILKAIEKDPEDRFADLQEMIADLRKVIGNSTMDFSASSTVQVANSHSTTELVPKGETSSLDPATSATSVPSQARILIPDRNTSVPLSEPNEKGLILGRTHGNHEADVDLGPYGAVENGISRRHSRLTKNGDDWYIDDLGSMNGTNVNNVRVTPGTPVAIKNGDIIHCGRMYLVFLTSAE